MNKPTLISKIRTVADRCLSRLVRRDLVWNSEKPTVAGWYWIRTPNLSPRITLFHHAHGQALLTCGYDLQWMIYKTPVEYAGPISLPNIRSQTQPPSTNQS